MGVRELINFLPEEKTFFEENFECFKLRKGSFLIIKEEIVEFLYFLEEGILNVCFPDQKGGHVNARFIEGRTFINPFFLHDREHKACYSVKANTDCIIWKMKKEKAMTLLAESHNFCKLSLLILEVSLLHRVQREEGIHCMSAEERYKRLLEKEKWLFRNLSLKDIASYISITPQALSKARKRIFD